MFDPATDSRVRVFKARQSWQYSGTRGVCVLCQQRVDFSDAALIRRNGNALMAHVRCAEQPEETTPVGLPGRSLDTPELLVKRGRIEMLVPLDRIYYFHADRQYIEVETDEGTHYIIGALSSLIERFGDQVIQTERAYLANVEYIRGWVGGANGDRSVFLLMANGDRIPVAKRQRKAVRAWMLDRCV